MSRSTQGVMFVWLLTGATAWAGRPLTIDDADAVDVRQVEVEAGACYEHDSECDHWDVPFGVTLGVVPGVEAGIGFGSQFEERTEVIDAMGAEDRVHEHGIGDLIIGAKWRFLEESHGVPRQALAPSVKFPTADDDKGMGSGQTDYDLTWIASKSIGERGGAHANVGYSWIGTPPDEDVGDIVHGGLALDYQVTAPVQWIGEVFAAKELQDSTETAVQFTSGLRWNPIESVTVDLAGGSRIAGEAPDLIVTAGLTWAFGSTHPETK